MKHIHTGLLALTLIYSSSCKKSFLDSAPLNEVTTATYYQNDNDFITSVNGIYNVLTIQRQTMEFFPMIDMATPIAVKGSARFGQFEWGSDGFTATNMHPTVVGAGGWYSSWWEGVQRANEVLKRVQINGNVISTVALRNRIQGEALFLRAQFYFFLTYIWGDVPLITGDATANPYPANTPHVQVAAQMIKDLTEAATLLPSVQTYRAGDKSNLGRASKGSALALLGKVYCFEQRWAEAETILKSLIDLGDYALTPGLTGFNDQFLPPGENGIESIFEIQYQNGLGDALGNAYVSFMATGGTGIDPGGNGNNYIEPTDYLADKYETVNGYKVTSQPVPDATYKCGYYFSQSSADPVFDPANPFNNRDPRLMWTAMYTGSPYVAAKFPGNTFTSKATIESPYATVKYIYPQPSFDQSAMNLIVMRYADALLLYAEASLEQGKLGQAVTYINMIRRRPSVNMPPVPATVAGDQAQLREYLHEERIRELACEYGHVFFDLRRWGTYVQVMKGYWTANKFGHTNPAIIFDNHNVLWPFPQSELDVNPNLKQNPGY